jgi:hypothetical protein
VPSLAPFDGEVSVPCWALRPGAVDALRPVARALPLWLCIRSSNGKRLRPCTASRATLAATVGASPRSITDRCAELRDAGLLLELWRPEDPKAGSRPPARFATDPKLWWRDRERIEARVPELAEESGLGARWVSGALRGIERHDAKVRTLARAICAEIDGASVAPPGKRCHPPLASLATNEGVGGEGGNERREASSVEGGPTGNGAKPPKGRTAENRGSKKKARVRSE